MKSNFPFATPGQKLEIDILMNELGVKTEQMMELAGRDIARLCLKLSKGPVLIFCGKGHNAGDGLCAAKYLLNYNIPVAVVLVEPENKLRGVEKKHLEVLKKLKVSIFKLGHPQLPKIAGAADLLIDALVGFRLNRNPRSPIKEAINFMNSSAKKILSVDIPTGLDGLTGEKHFPAVKAKYCVALGVPLKGMQDWKGKLYVSEIGIPDRVYKAVKMQDKPRFKKNTIIKV